MPWLPVVLALSANSPWFAGVADRHGVEPRAGARRAAARGRRRRRSRRTASGSRGSSGSSALGVAEDYTRIWWDVRPHPKLGTLEVRDRRPADGRRAVVGVRGAPAGDVRDRARRWTAGRRDARRPRARRLRAEPLGGRALRPSRRAAASRGSTASCPASELGAELLALVTPAARALGGADALARIDPAACEADLQLQSGSARRGGGRTSSRGRSANLRVWPRSRRRSRSAASAARSA